MNKSALSALWVSLVLGVAVFLTGINRAPVPTVDGAIRATQSRTILQKGSWFPFEYQGVSVTDHPPLYIWLGSASMKMFGVNDFAANLPTRVFSALNVPLTTALGLSIGLTPTASLAASVILITTRHFVLNGVRGYIEPLMQFFAYFAVLCLFLYARKPLPFLPAAAGISVWLALFSKGPPAVWPLLALVGWILVASPERKKALWAYLGGFFGMAAVFIIWTTLGGHWEIWKTYFTGQILSSAVQGRGSQELEPLYFLKIMGKFYWPWLPFSLIAVLFTLRDFIQYRKVPDQRPRALALFFLSLFALGFIGGFSLVKWKFWYYTVPAYLALSVVIVGAFESHLERLLSRVHLERILLGLSVVWMLAMSILPIQLYRERVPEIMAFKDAITHSGVAGPVWVVGSPSDFNQLMTSGEWYFDRRVLEPKNRLIWERNELQSPAWILVGDKFLQSCQENWCTTSMILSRENGNALAFYTRREK